jgi:hypothetical protein
MKKKEVVRAFNFSDAVFVTKTKEKIAFMRRDATQFDAFGIDKSAIAALEKKINSFADTITDIEAVGDQTTATALKDAKAEELRVAIRALMSRVVLKFAEGTSKYAKFGTDTLSKQTDADLFITGKRVVRVANMVLTELSEKGLTPDMLTNITALCTDLEDLIVDMKIKMGDRDAIQEERVEAANAIYTTLVSYTNTGQSLWTTSNVAKYNDYVLYNTPTGDALVIVTL